MTDHTWPVCALGLMSGTSYDAVDVAALRTDGVTIAEIGPAMEVAYTEDERALIARATEAAQGWGFDGPDPDAFASAEAIVTAAHARAVAVFVANHPGWAPDLVGFHGQTVLHRPPANRPGATRQLGDARALARLIRADVAFDFRSADVAVGGHGAPLAPIYHWARARMDAFGSGVAVLNLGGVANITFLADDPSDITAFDTGPANGMLDAVTEARGAGPCDAGGAYAAAGSVDPAALARLLDHRHFDAPPPKSLDRFAFSPGPVEALSLEDACATLTAFTAQTVARALSFAPQPVSRILAAGGGVNNPVLMAAIAHACGVPVETAAGVGWRPDALEAECFAYLAVRTARDLPLSFPGTTGAPAPTPGGRLAPWSDEVGRA